MPSKFYFKLPRGGKKVDKDDICDICLENFIDDDSAAVTVCSNDHLFHLDCINQQLQHDNTCPDCKEIITSLKKTKRKNGTITPTEIIERRIGNVRSQQVNNRVDAQGYVNGIYVGENQFNQAMIRAQRIEQGIITLLNTPAQDIQRVQTLQLIDSTLLNADTYSEIDDVLNNIARRNLPNFLEIREMIEVEHQLSMIYNIQPVHRHAYFNRLNTYPVYIIKRIIEMNYRLYDVFPLVITKLKKLVYEINRYRLSRNMPKIIPIDPNARVRVSRPRVSPVRVSRSRVSRPRVSRPVRSLKPCKEGQQRNPDTNRCRKIVQARQSRPRRSQSRRRELKPCKEGQVRNPLTNRCKKV